MEKMQKESWFALAHLPGLSAAADNQKMRFKESGCRADADALADFPSCFWPARSRGCGKIVFLKKMLDKQNPLCYNYSCV